MKIKWELINSDDDTDAFFPDDEISDYEKSEEDNYEMGGMVTKKVMQTPFGFAVVDDGLNPFKDIQILVFHTDFYITKKVKDDIETTPGVEVLKILTPYRGSLCVGKCFNSTDVRREIEKRIIKKEIPNEQIRLDVDDLKQKLSAYDNWSILVHPNGYIDYAYLTGDNAEQYNKLVELYSNAVLLNNGILINKNE